MATQKQTTGLEADAWARRTAKTLRRTHASFTASGVADREGFLSDQIKESLREAGAATLEERDNLLRRLGHCFSGDTDGFTPAPEGGDAAGQARNSVEQVKAIWREASGPARQEILQALASEAPELADRGPDSRSSAAAAGREVTDRVRLPVNSDEMEAFKAGIDKLWKVLGHDSQPEPAIFYRVWKLLGILAEAYGALHNVMWTFWRNEAPEELQIALATRVPGFPEAFLESDLAGLIGSYLTNPESMSSDKLYQEVDATKRLYLGAVEAMRFGGKEFFKSLSRISPEAIENTVRFGSRGALKDDALSSEAWDKYKDLTKHDFNEVEVRDQFKKCAINYLYAWIDSNSRR